MAVQNKRKKNKTTLSTPTKRFHRQTNKSNLKMGGTPSLGCPWPPALPDHDEDDYDDDDDDHNDDNDDDTPSFSSGYCRAGCLIKSYRLSRVSPAKVCLGLRSLL